MTKGQSIAISLIVLIASIVGIAMSVNGFLATQHKAEVAHEAAVQAQKDYDTALRDYNNALNSNP